MAADEGVKIEVRDGVHYLSGEMNEYSDFSELQQARAPLLMNIKGLTRLNSIGIRNLLKFLNSWGDQQFAYLECTTEFVDQLNMIPALLGIRGQGVVQDLYVPFECDDCGHEHEFFGKTEDFSGEEPVRPCPQCSSEMFVVSDSYFVFLDR